MVVMCNFDTGFRPPEMIKIRPVIVLSAQRHNRETCVVVPVSTTKPYPIEAFHHKLEPASLPDRLRKSESWVKGNMITTVANWRLDRVRVARNPDGSRQYVAHKITVADWSAVQQVAVPGNTGLQDYPRVAGVRSADKPSRPLTSKWPPMGG